MNNFKGCKNYTLISTEFLKDIGANAYVLKHDKTGARVCLIDCDDENRAFMVGFRTIPEDSTGVPHIIEHSVLCGSEKYPVKDALEEAGKGSLNTFMNAFTYPDRTIYPIASVNEKDFFNLMKVYLDAVFKPNIYKNRVAFKQEGWHYELTDKDGDITINGIVYNEMKGAFSNPQSVLYRTILHSLFPDTIYGVESGGVPEFIPDLTYDRFIDFHKRMYHPSNCRIFIYGDTDFEEKLKYIDEEYLSGYDYLETNTEIGFQKPFDAPVYETVSYGVGPDEGLENKTFLSYNIVTSGYSEPEIIDAMDVINYALVSVPGAVLKERMLEAGIGADVYSMHTTDMGEKFFSIIAEGANASDRDRFVSIIEDTVKEVIKNGFDKKTLLAAIVSDEFAYREADFGFTPKGIEYGTMVYETWNFTDEDIFKYLKQGDMYEDLKKKIDTGFFEHILEERVLNNNHKSIIVMEPRKGVAEAGEEALKEKLKAFKATLSDEDLDNMIKETAELKAYQEAPESEENRNTIPSLSISDINKKGKGVFWKEKKVSGVRFVEQDINTNGILYATLSFDIKKVPMEDLKYLTLARMLLGQVDTQNYKYGELVNEISIRSGGISAGMTVYQYKSDPRKVDGAWDVVIKAFEKNIPDCFELVEEMLFRSDFSDKKRIKDIVNEKVIRNKDYMLQAGYAVAYPRALSYISPAAALTDKISGYDYYLMLKDLADNFDEKIDGYIQKIREVIKYVVTSDNITVFVTAGKETIAYFEKEFDNFYKKIPQNSRGRFVYDIRTDKKQEALTYASEVNNVALAGNYRLHGLDYNGSLAVLREILSSEYLWTEIRVKGGAYGSVALFRYSGDVLLFSYRDPNIGKTLDVFKGVKEFVENYDGDRDTIEKFIITAIGIVDTPLTPSQKGAKAISNYRTGLTNEDEDRSREELLNTDLDSIRGLSKYIDVLIKDSCLTVVGGDTPVNKEKELFLEVKNLV